MPWLQKLDIKNIDLGKGKRQVAANGILNKKYQITVPNLQKEISDKMGLLRVPSRNVND